MDFLQSSVFHNKFDGVDNREPLLRAGSWGITGIITLDPTFTMQMLMLVGMTEFICTLGAVLAYFGIVVPRRRRKGTVSDLLLGYGVILPLLLGTPCFVIQRLDIRNCLLLLNMVGSPVLATMRLLETMHATDKLPAFVEGHLGYYCLHFALALVVDHENTKPTKATAAQLRQKAYKVLSLFLQATLLLSFLAEYEYRPFQFTGSSSLWGLVHWTHLLNNWLTVSLISVTLDVGCTFGEVALGMMTGLLFVDSHRAPMTGSTSVSDFWGQRWNRIVADSLKRGAYQPLKQQLGFSKPVAAILTFLASGVLHEYMLFVLSAARRSDVPANNLLRQPYQHQLGNQFAFFLWNGILLILEELFKRQFWLVWIQNNVPKPLRTAMVSLLVLPITNWFTDEYDEAGIFRDVAMAFPRIQYHGTTDTSFDGSSAYQLLGEESLLLIPRPAVQGWTSSIGDLFNSTTAGLDDYCDSPPACSSFAERPWYFFDGSLAGAVLASAICQSRQ